MTFEDTKTKFTVFSFNNELCNLIKSDKRRYQNRSGELNYSFLKALIVLSGLSKSFPYRESIELQAN